VIRALGLAIVIATHDGGCDDDDGGGSVDMLSADPVARGHFYVTARGCPSCHQSKNPADGTLSGTTSPREGTSAYPANLTPDVDTGIGSWSDDQLARAIREGTDLDGLELCPEMNHFSTMTDYEVYSIIKSLRSLPPVNNKVLRSVCPPLKTKDEQTAAM